MSIASVPDERWDGGEFCAVAAVSVPLSELATRCGFSTETFESDGLGSTIQARCSLADGTRFILNEFLSNPCRPSTEIWCQRALSVDPQLLSKIVQALGLPPTSVTWRDSRATPPRPLPPAEA